MDVRPKKHLGQHFLIDGNVISKIVDAVEAPEDARVIEIGPGAGALTDHLVQRYEKLSVIEVDPEAVGFLHERHPGLDIRQQDVLEVNWEELSDERGLFVVGNLPYNITSPILFSLLDARAHIRRSVVMIQKEVAERIVAVPGSKAYGILSVQTQLLAQPSLLFSVSRHVFRPKPDVESAVIALDFSQDNPLLFDVQQMKRVVRTAFGQRRKMLRNSLSGLCEELEVELPEIVSTKRPEALTPEEFVELTNMLFSQTSKMQ